MARNTTPAPATKEVIADAVAIGQTMDAANQLAVMNLQANANAQALAHDLGYAGALTVGALEDEIRFYQQRSVEAMLEAGKRLLLLKEITPHGEFAQRVDMLGFAERTAQRFMQAANKVRKSATVAVLAGHVKNSKAFLELITHDDDVIENLADLDDFDRMSASQLRAMAREMAAEKHAVEKVLFDKNTAMDKLRAQVKRVQAAPPDEQLLQLQKEATAIMNDALGAIRGGLRKALEALNDAPADAPSQSVFMAGLVGQVAADLATLRQEFNLPDVSNAADAALAADVAQWAN